MTEVTTLLNAASAGDKSAEAQLYELFYDQLRAVAANEIGRWRPGQTLQVTALVDELYLKFVRGKRMDWPNRRCFVDAAAVAMHRIMIDYHRRAAKQVQRQPLPEGGPVQQAIAASPIEPLDLKILLEEYELHNERGARALRFRYVLGLPMEQIAALMQVSIATAERDVRRARGWLKERLFGGHLPDG